MQLLIIWNCILLPYDGQYPKLAIGKVSTQQTHHTSMAYGDNGVGGLTLM